MAQPGTDDERIASWVASVNRAFTRRGVDRDVRTAFVQELTRHLAIARAQGRATDDLLSEDAESFTRRTLETHQRAAVRATPLPLVLTGLSGAATGAALVWFGLYERVVLRLTDDQLDLLPLVLSLDVLAVVVVLACVTATTWVGFGRDLPTLTPRLAGLAVIAALLAWPAISGYGYTTDYSVNASVLATEIVIGAVFLTAAMLTARRWAIRTDLVRRARLPA